MTRGGGRRRESTLAHGTPKPAPLPQPGGPASSRPKFWEDGGLRGGSHPPSLRGAAQSGSPRSQLIRGGGSPHPRARPSRRLGRGVRLGEGRGGGGAAIVRSAPSPGRRGKGEGITERASESGAPGGVTAGRRDSHSRRGLRVPPRPSPEAASAAARDSAVAGARRRQPPRPRGLPRLARPSPSSSAAPVPLLAAARLPLRPRAEWCRPPPADPPGIPARSPGLAPACAPAPSPSPRRRCRRRRCLRGGPRPSRRAPPPPPSPPPPSTMGDAGSERSKAPSLPPRCPCGFWGSSKTMNLCSKCFADFQKKQPDDDSTPSTSNSQSDLFPEETTSDNNNTSVTTPTLSPSQPSLPTELNVTSPSKEECKSIREHHRTASS